MLRWTERQDDNGIYYFESCSSNTTVDEMVEVIKFIDETIYHYGGIGIDYDFNLYWDADDFIRHIIVSFSSSLLATAFKLRWL